MTDAGTEQSSEQAYRESVKARLLEFSGWCEVDCEPEQRDDDGDGCVDIHGGNVSTGGAGRK